MSVKMCGRVGFRVLDNGPTGQASTRLAMYYTQVARDTWQLDPTTFDVGPDDKKKKNWHRRFFQKKIMLSAHTALVLSSVVLAFGFQNQN